MTATGSCRPGDEDFNGAANFLADKMEDNGVQATAKTAQIFLGMAVQCTQCHNHPFNEHQQNQFWELNAFFRQTRVERTRLDDDQRQRFVGRVVDRDFRGETGDVDEGRPVLRAAQRADEGGVPGVRRRHVAGGDVPRQGRRFWRSTAALEDINRREELAKLIVASREFDRAMVNRLWGRFLGYGFTKPVDDIGPHNAPSHPELLDQLGLGASADSGFDLKQLMRWIVLSEPYRSIEQDDPRQRGGRPDARRPADVQPFLPAADGGRAAVRIAAGGDRGGRDGPRATGATRCGSGGCGSSTRRSARMTAARRLRSTARSRRR